MEVVGEGQNFWGQRSICPQGLMAVLRVVSGSWGETALPPHRGWALEFSRFPGNIAQC